MALLSVGPASGETTFTFYSGRSFTSASDVRLRQPTQDRNVRFEGVGWDAEDFTSPIYYGLRVTHYQRKKPWLGASIDFFHYKVFARTGERVRAVGSEGGAPVDRRQRLDDTVQRLSISHGVNYLTLNLQARLRWRRDARYPDGRIQPYVGVGFGGVLLHPESTIGGESFQQYEWNGLGYQLFLGVTYMVRPRWGLFAEYKFNSRGVNVRVVEGSAETDLTTHHLVFGAGYRL